MDDSIVTGTVEESVTETALILVDDTMDEYALQLIANHGFKTVLLCIIAVVIVSIIRAVIQKLLNKFDTEEIKRVGKHKKKKK